MASAPLFVSEAEYLCTSYRPDCDYVDGTVIERNLGQFEHARLQALILMWLMQHEQDWGILVLVEQRLKIRQAKYRIPDVMVLSADAPRTPIIESPPLVCIEVISPDDRMRDLTARGRDYLEFGVAETWILDPQERQAYVYSAAGLHQVSEFALGKITLNPASLFAQL